jgi:AcrR family transcriptional regulator
MAREDWLVGGDRGTAASERIYDAATDLITHSGLDAFDIDELAARVHCSRATIYRHVGGKGEIRDAVLIRAAQRFLDSIRLAVDDLSGHERITTAITVALEMIRSDPLGQVMLKSIRAQDMSSLAESPIVMRFAIDINGLAEDDPQAAHWIVRVLLAMLYWPVGDTGTERETVERFVAPAFGGPTVEFDRS